MAGWAVVYGLMRRGTLKLVTRKAACQALGGRVLIGGWAPAARQGSKLLEARVEPHSGPSTSEALSDAPRSPSSSRGKQEARDTFFHPSLVSSHSNSHSHFLFLVSSPGLDFSIHNTAQPEGRTSLSGCPTTHSLLSWPALPRLLAASPEKRSETNATQILFLPKQKYPTKPPHSSPRRVFVHHNSPLSLLL